MITTKDFGNLKECVLIFLDAVVIAVFHGICSSFAFRYFHYTKREKQKKLCGRAFTQYKYRLRNKGDKQVQTPSEYEKSRYTEER